MELTNGWEIGNLGGKAHGHYIRIVDGKLVTEIVQWMLPKTLQYNQQAYDYHPVQGVPQHPYYTTNKHMITILFRADHGIDVPDHIENCEQAMEYANALYRLGETK